LLFLRVCCSTMTLQIVDGRALQALVRHSLGIIQQFKNMPKIQSLTAKAPEATICWLVKEGIIAPIVDQMDVLVQSLPESDPKKAWNVFKENIITYLKKKLQILSAPAHLEKACELVGEKIWRDYYARYPKWPSQAQGSQAATILVVCQDTYYNDPFHVVFEANGSFDVKDVNNGGKYTAYCQSDVIFKILSVDKDKLEGLEDTIASLRMSTDDMVAMIKGEVNKHWKDDLRSRMLNFRQKRLAIQESG